MFYSVRMRKKLCLGKNTEICRRYNCSSHWQRDSFMFIWDATALYLDIFIEQNLSAGLGCGCLTGMWSPCWQSIISLLLFIGPWHHRQVGYGLIIEVVISRLKAA